MNLLKILILIALTTLCAFITPDDPILYETKTSIDTILQKYKSPTYFTLEATSTVNRTGDMVIMDMTICNMSGQRPCFVLTFNPNTNRVKDVRKVKGMQLDLSYVKLDSELSEQHRSSLNRSFNQ